MANPKYTIVATTDETVDGVAGTWQHIEITFEDDRIERQSYFVPTGTNVATFLRGAVLEVTDTGEGGVQRARVSRELKRVEIAEGDRTEVSLTRPSRG